MEQTKDNSFAQVCAELTALHERKNHDYGNTFGRLFQGFLSVDGKKAAMIYAIGHMTEKVNRVQSVTFNGTMIKEESMEDSLYDLASYAIMTLAELHRKQPTDK